MSRWWCAVCVAVTALTSWELLKYVVPFIVFKHQQKLLGNHETLLCRPHESCKLAARNFTMTPEEMAMNSVFSPDLSVDDIERIYGVWERRFAWRRRQGSSPPLILHIGPADLDDDELFMYSRVAPQGVRVAFAEPHPFQRARLQERLREIRNASLMSMSVLSVALCPNSNDSVSFYKISDRFFEDFRETGWLYLIRYWASLDKHHLIRELEVFCNQTGKVWLFKALNMLSSAFPSTLDEWLPYIEELRVSCRTPLSFLEEINAGPDAVDVLIVDAEGYDTALVGMFLALDGFAPSTVMFEWHLHGNDPTKLKALVRLVGALHERGYEVHRHNHDVIAFTY